MASELRGIHHWIGGRLVASESGRTGVVWNPATGEAQANVDFANAGEVDAERIEDYLAADGYLPSEFARRGIRVRKFGQQVIERRRGVHQDTPG